jgi:hypothetical protein
MKIHHLGIVIRNLPEALDVLELEESRVLETVADHEQNNNLYFLHLPENNLWIELVEPLNANSTVSTFQKRNGMALHHIGIEVNDLAQIDDQYRKKSGAFVLGGYRISVESFGGKISTKFVHAKGILLEFLQVG